MNGENGENKSLTQHFSSNFFVFFSKSYQSEKIIYDCLETYLESK